MNKMEHVPSPPEASSLIWTGKVLIIHGHDELNLLRLKEILRRLGLEMVLLNELPARGNTIIEKFERQAPVADFAIVFMTPDDVVVVGEIRYSQARANVHIELGWAYCNFGRANVCLLVKKGTHIPSDIEGINRVEFDDSVKEVAHQLEDELESAGIIKRSVQAPTH